MRFNTLTRLGAAMSAEHHFRIGGLVGFMSLELLDAYIDASGKDSNPSDMVLTISGCLSTPNKWQEFDLEWQALLKREGFSPDAEFGAYVFHAAPFWSGNCDLMPNGLTRRDKQRIYRGLVEIIRTHTLYRFGHAILLNDFRALETEFPHVRGHITGKPGTLISQLCFVKNSEWAIRNNYNPSIAYIFDWGDEFWGELESGHRVRTKHHKGRQLKEGEYRYVASLKSANDAEFSPIQAADLIAWATRDYFSKRLTLHKVSKLVSAIKPNYEMSRLETKDGSGFFVYHKDTLKQEMHNRFGFILNEMNLHEQASVLIGEGKPFKDADDLVKFAIKIQNDEKARKAKASRAVAKEKKQRR